MQKVQILRLYVRVMNKNPLIYERKEVDQKAEKEEEEASLSLFSSSSSFLSCGIYRRVCRSPPRRLDIPLSVSLVAPLAVIIGAGIILRPAAEHRRRGFFFSLDAD